MNTVPDTVVIDGIERPTHNSAGRVIHDTPEGIRNFWRWFGDSLVIDEQGRPLIMYHGTYNGAFDTFDREWSTAVRSRSMDTVGVWFSDTAGEAGAQMYANSERACILPVYLSATRLKYVDFFDDFLRAMHAAEGRRLEDMNPRGLGSAEGFRAQLQSQGYDALWFPRNDSGDLLTEINALNEAIHRTSAEYRAERERLARLGLEMSYRDGLPYQAKIDRLVLQRTQMQTELNQYRSSTEFAGQSVAVVMEPTQIKSAIGNSGRFDPASASLTDAEDVVTPAPKTKLRGPSL